MLNYNKMNTLREQFTEGDRLQKEIIENFTKF